MKQHQVSILPGPGSDMDGAAGESRHVAQGGCGGVNISYAVCGDEDSRSRYPQWPKCTITPSVWDTKLCV